MAIVARQVQWADLVAILMPSPRQTSTCSARDQLSLHLRPAPLASATSKRDPATDLLTSSSHPNGRTMATWLGSRGSHAVHDGARHSSCR